MYELPSSVSVTLTVLSEVSALSVCSYPNFVALGWQLQTAPVNLLQFVNDSVVKTTPYILA